MSAAVTTTPPGGVIVAHEEIPCDLFSGQNKLARLKIECAGGLAPYQVRLNAKATFDIAVEDVELYNGEPLIFQLERFLQAVDRTINRFEAEFV